MSFAAQGITMIEPYVHRRLSDWIGFGFFITLSVMTLIQAPMLGILMMPTLALEVFTAVAFLVRERPRAALRSARAWVAAYGGTYFLMIFVQWSRWFVPSWLTPGALMVRGVGLLLWIGGAALAAYAIWYLRSSFSIVPEARQLITSGPYAIARHPVYVAYFVMYGGMWLMYPTTQFAIALACWLSMMLSRMYYEERVLASAFPEYAAYRRRVGALGPWPLWPLWSLTARFTA
jgi:protein-S-isoprenylcysteine O-methyltransferase Ste14